MSETVHDEGDRPGDLRTAPPDPPAPSHPDPIAIVGIGCRLPGGVTGPRSFWELLLAGTDAIRDVPKERWNHELFHHPVPGTRGRTPARQAGFVDGLDLFDASFFGISPREAAHMDPQHRMLLEVGWEALEDAGVPLERAAGEGTGVFVGIASSEYGSLQTTESLGTHSSTGVASCMAANRLSFAFDLRGPSVSVDTACSSALVAVHLACQSLRSGETTLALAGGVNALVDPSTFVGFSQLSMLSPDSRCYAFDERANGFVRGEGAGVLVLEPLSRALANGDRVYALLLATGTNQDGHSQGLTFPSLASQEALLAEVSERAGVAPSAFRFVEAHGTGTQAGDPIEANAIGHVLGRGRGRDDALWLGSVKTNIGHLEAAAGIAGLIKAALAVHHRTLPPNLNFRTPSPRIDFEQLGLRVPVRTEPLGGDAPIVAGVNSFGFGGTNAHAVLGEAPPSEEAPCPDRRRHLLVLSARSPEALSGLAQAHAELLGSVAGEGAAVADLLHAAAVRRTASSHRLAVVGESAAELAGRLDGWRSGGTAPGVVTGRATPDRRPRVAFVYSGQGSQWWAMGRGLLASEPLFRAEVERCDRVVRELGGWSLLEELEASEARSRLHETAVAQPALFALQAGLTALYRSLGVEPEAIVGHSVGENAAAFAAGVFDLEDGARIAFHRGRTMDRPSTRGRMLSVSLSRDEALRYLEGRAGSVSLAVVNGPATVVLSGEDGAIAAITDALARDGVPHRPVRVEYAFHSPQLDAIASEVREALGGLVPRAPSRRIVSTVTGEWATGGEWDVPYWWRNVRDTVRFADAIDVLLRHGCNTFVEVGPHPVLTASVQECARARGLAVETLPSLRRGADDHDVLFGTLASLWTKGCAVRLSTLYPRGRSVSLPPHPWQRVRCWSEAEERRHDRFVSPSHPLLGRPEPGAVRAWSSRLGAPFVAWTADHRFQGHPIVPATAWLEMALAAAEPAPGEAPRCVEEAAFESAAFLPDGEPLRVESSLVEDGTRFEVAGRRPGETAWTRYASARLATAAPAPAPESLEAIAGRLPEELPAASIYEAFRSSGLDYGPSFRGIRGARRRDGEALGEVVLPAALEAEAASLNVHPALLDACLQVVLAAIPSDERQRGKAYLPVALRRLTLFRRPGARVFAHARLLDLGPDAFTAEVRVLDASGELLLAAEGFRCKAVDGAGADAGLDPLLHRFTWKRQEREADEGPGEAGTWLLLEDAAGLGARLGTLLRERGQRVVALVPEAVPAPADGARAAIEPTRPEDVRAALSRIAADGPPLAGIVHLRSLDAAAPADLGPAEMEAADALGAASLLHVVQALEEAGGDARPQLVVVTCHAQAVDENDRARLSPAQASLWGLRRVLTFEHRRLRPRIVDVGDPAADADALAAELLAGGAEDEVALRDGARLVSRYERTSLSRVAPERTVRGRPADVPFHAESRNPGVLDALRLVGGPRPEPGEGQVLVEVKAAGLNFADVLKAHGLYPGRGPFPLGAECAGVVRAVGAPSRSGGPLPAPGERVLALGSPAFASHVLAAAPYVARIPDGLDFAQAAAIPIVFLTAHYALAHVARLGAGERVLVHSATGGVGLAALQVARHLGAEVLATAGTEEKREVLRRLGVRHVFDSRSLAFAGEVLAATGGEGVDVVLNSLVGDAIPRALEALRPFGRFVEIGKRDIYANARLGLGPFRDNLSLAAVDLDQAIRTRPALVATLLHEVCQGFAEGWLAPLPVTTFPVTELVEAFRTLSKAKHVGKVVVSCDVPEVEVSVPAARPPVRPDATYLVTGGMGGLGSVLAERLAEAGARHVLLLGRRGAASPGAARVVEALARHGCAAHVRAVDVSDLEALRAVVREAGTTLPPLRGVVHAAVVFDDGVATRIDRSRLAAVTRPKAHGAWNLHLLTRDLPLDFFLLTSSVAAVVSSPGQSSYAAANAFLDALAHYRRGLGLPALALDLGPVGDVGHIARHAELSGSIEALGLASLSAAEVARACDELLASEEPQLGVARVDWARLAAPPAAPAPRFAELAASGGTAASEAGGDGSRGLAATLAASPEAERETLLRDALVGQLARVLGTDPSRLDVEKPLSELGLDSLMGVELGMWVEDSLGFRLPAAELMRDPTAAALARSVLALWGARSGGGAAPVEARLDLRAEAVLEPGVAPAAGGAFGPLRNVLLTGATGFLGSFLLRELLSAADTPVRCLVRAGDAEEGRRRVREALEARGLWDDSFDGRVVAVPGDLGRPLLGLSPEAFERLAVEAECVVHAGAAVDFLRTYEAMRSANVVGTQEALRLACRARPKPFHHVSSIAVFGARLSGLVAEDEVPEDVTSLPDGYSRSKWVAEGLVREAARRGLPVRVYRPGILSGRSTTGEANRSDALLQLVRASCLLGLAPDLPARADVTPVDLAAAALVRIASRPDAEGTFFHLCSPEPVSLADGVAWLRELGYRLEVVPYAAYRERFAARADELSLQPLLALLPEDEEGARLRIGAESRRFDLSRTRQALGDAFPLRPVDRELLGVYARWMEREGLLPR